MYLKNTVSEFLSSSHADNYPSDSHVLSYEQILGSRLMECVLLRRNRGNLLILHYLETNQCDCTSFSLKITEETCEVFSAFT
jgi:hypothetical protein